MRAIAISFIDITILVNSETCPSIFLISLECFVEVRFLGVTQNIVVTQQSLLSGLYTVKEEGLEHLKYYFLLFFESFKISNHWLTNNDHFFQARPYHV